MNMQTQWRLALMFDAPGGDLARLEELLKHAAKAVCTAATPNPVRIGIADHHPDLLAATDIRDAVSHWRTVDGALEVTVPNERANDLPQICRTLRPLLADILDWSRLEAMAGPIFPMVPDRKGNAFISLAFRRSPGRTVQQFRDWWRKQHSQIAIPVLSPQLLAYDQVHVEQAASCAAADVLGVPYSDYDAYDNLTWGDRHAFLESCTQDPDGMARIRADEIGNIDDTTRRHSLMRELV
jgi:EthD domain-containing protein